MIAINYADPRHPEIKALLMQSHALMQSLYSEEENHYLSLEALCKKDVRFFAAQIHGAYVGCVALALKEGYGELKSMFSDPHHRGKGVAKALMTALEREAISLGFDLMRLETGEMLKEAVTLYTKFGFIRRGPFGDYRDDPASVFMEKSLNATHTASAP
tara:strand:+ start:439 stop:915 length:477 start_codon:yes stop_codon:yes gene_type:complete